MSNFQMLKVSNLPPASDDFSFFDANLNADYEITTWVSLTYWVDTADVAAGAFTMDLEYVDPTGATRQINGSPISLADSSGFFSSPVVPMQRQSAASLMRAISTLIGPAGTSTVSVRIRFSGDYNSDGQFTDWNMA